jgi:hypothetical protein
MALPDFLLPITLPTGALSLLARDVTVAEFFHGFPNSAPSMPCYEKESPEGQHGITSALEGWADALLTRVVLEPKLSLASVHRLGIVRDEALLTYLRTVGWIPSGAQAEPARSLTPTAPPIDTDTWARMEAAWIVSLPPFTTVPVENIKAALKLVASKCRTAPHEVWTRWRISEFLFDWRVLLQDDLLKRAGGPGPSSGDFLRDVGIEEDE